MRLSVCSIPVLSTALLLLLQVREDEATLPVTLGALALTAPQVTGLATLAILTKISAVAGGLLASNLGNRGGRRRGKRSVEVEDLEMEMFIKLLSEMEPEQCFKRVICGATTGNYNNTQKLDGIMSLINEKATDMRAGEFLAAAQYGYLTKDDAKCEQRYQCSMDLEIIQTVF